MSLGVKRRREEVVGTGGGENWVKNVERQLIITRKGGNWVGRDRQQQWTAGVYRVKDVRMIACGIDVGDGVPKR